MDAIVQRAHIQGVWTALITPFFEGKVDYFSLEKLLNFQLNAGIQGLVLMDIAGENATLNDNERKEILIKIFQYTRHRFPVWISVGSNCTHRTLQDIQEAERLGVDGFLIITPYYTQPTQRGLYLHFAALAQATAKPICLCSAPTRCGVELASETVAHLRKNYKNIIALKEAGGSCNRVSQLIKSNDKHFAVLAGDDALALPFFSLGAKGVVSIASNWIADALVNMFQLTASNDLESAANINRKFYPLFRALTIEPSPVTIKQILYRANFIRSPEVRLPLCPLSDKSLTLINKTFESLQVQLQ